MRAERSRQKAAMIGGRSGGVANCAVPDQSGCAPAARVGMGSPSRRRARSLRLVMAGLVPAISIRRARCLPGRDEIRACRKPLQRASDANGLLEPEPPRGVRRGAARAGCQGVSNALRPLDAAAQIRLFGKMKLAKCARAERHPGFFIFGPKRARFTRCNLQAPANGPALRDAHSFVASCEPDCCSGIVFSMDQCRGAMHSCGGLSTFVKRIRA
jgi:hypothetical protein